MEALKTQTNFELSALSAPLPQPVPNGCGFLFPAKFGAQAKHFPRGTTVPLPQNFRCPLCSRVFSLRGFASHIGKCCTKHEMSLSDYERLHSTYLYSPVHQFAAKWFSLARFSITEFGLMDYGNCYWYHLDADKSRPLYRGSWGRKPETLPLLLFDDGKPRLRRGFYHFREHLEGSLTLGIWPDLDNRFTVIDLDGDQVSLWEELRDRLIDLHLHFCIEYSGRKGLHLWIFWNQDLSNTELIELHEFLCNGIPSDHNCWPFKRSLIKLPLGLHRKTNQLACFLDYEGQPIPLEDQFKYFLAITTNAIPREFENRTEELPEEGSNPHIILNPAEEESLPNNEPAAIPDIPPKLAEEENSTAYEECLRLGRKLSCGRHLTLFHLAIHLKENRKLDGNQSLSILEEWSSQVPSKHPPKERLRDARSTVERVFEKGVTGTSLVRSDLTEEEVLVIQRVCETLISVCVAVGSSTRREDLSKRLKTTLKVALTMVSLAKTQRGTLEISYRTLAKLAGVSMNTLQRSLRVLVEDGAPLPPDDADIDPVLWYTDRRPKRSGGLFRCPRRGTYANRSNSVYHLKDTIRQALGWA